MGDKEKTAVKLVYDQELKLGDVWYLINAKWWDQWKDYVNWREVASDDKRLKEEDDPAETPRKMSRRLSFNGNIYNIEIFVQYCLMSIGW